MGQPVVHFEFWSPEPEKTTAFYTDVFDWKINYNPELTKPANSAFADSGGTSLATRATDSPSRMTFSAISMSLWERAW